MFILFLLVKRGDDGTGSSSTCDGMEQEGDFCNESKNKCEEECGGKWCTNACDFFQCPPRRDVSPEVMFLRNDKLCKVQSSLKKKGACRRVSCCTVIICMHTLPFGILFVG